MILIKLRECNILLRGQGNSVSLFILFLPFAPFSILGKRHLLPLIGGKKHNPFLFHLKVLCPFFQCFIVPTAHS